MSRRFDSEFKVQTELAGLNANKAHDEDSDNGMIFLPKVVDVRQSDLTPFGQIRNSKFVQNKP